MAFFKFRFPGKSASAEGASVGESLEAVRQRARHRLLGATVLVLVAVVAFPLIFDSQPRPVAVDTPVVIPGRESTPVLTANAVVPAAQAPAKPLLPASQATVSVGSSLEPGKEEVVLSGKADQALAHAPQELAASESRAAASTDKREEASQHKVEAKPVAKPEVKAEPKPAAKPESKPAAKPEKPEAKADAKRHEDGNRAKALLDGGSADAHSKSKAAIQVGAFTDADKVREVRHKLEQAGLKTYTQVVEKDGKKTTRVRLGPFDSKDEAEKAAAKVRKLNLPASVLGL